MSKDKQPGWDEISHMPYRPCVGIVLINNERKLFAGRRADTPDAWQMPQGGIDDGETPREAALRELREETGLKKKHVHVLAETRNWIPYDLPPELIGKLWKGRYRGQIQKWIAMHFVGADTDVDIAFKDKEFCEWRWMETYELTDKIVDFKRDTYYAVFDEFEKFLIDEDE